MAAVPDCMAGRAPHMWGLITMHGRKDGETTVDHTCDVCGATEQLGNGTMDLQIKSPTSAERDAFTQSLIDAFMKPISDGAGGSLTPVFVNGWRNVGDEDFDDDRPELELSFDTEPIVGWRMWRVVHFDLLDGRTEPRLLPLASRAQNGAWTPRRRAEAVCNHRNHQAPVEDCTCGMWAWRGEKRVLDQLVIPTTDNVVYGTVSLWGRVLEFEQGHRGQYAYPDQLFANDVETARSLQDVYGVPCVRPADPGSRGAPSLEKDLKTVEAMAKIMLANGGFTDAMKKFATQMEKAARLMGPMLTPDEARKLLDFPEASPPA